MKNLYIHYGCGLDAPKQWLNFDVSPTLKLQKLPLLGSLIRKMINPKWPKNIKVGNIVKNLPGIDINSCNGIYCSHILEHLSLQDFRKALKNTYNYLKPDGIFRLIVPDLQYSIEEYILSVPKNPNAAIEFMQNTMLGENTRKKGLKGILYYLFANSKHLWMWDYPSLKNELKIAGFTKIRRCEYGDASDSMFKLVENKDRFKNAVAIEAIK